MVQARGAYTDFLCGEDRRFDGGLHWNVRHVDGPQYCHCTMSTRKASISHSSVTYPHNGWLPCHARNGRMVSLGCPHVQRLPVISGINQEEGRKEVLQGDEDEMEVANNKVCPANGIPPAERVQMMILHLVATLQRSVAS
mmetsp:Transcript_5171/g.7247  ORF Transcript_5171/g.7247 Transcript_5171/m.7247 type:complete len:140 (-) Transcript_5171:711-1130(-)